VASGLEPDGSRHWVGTWEAHFLVIDLVLVIVKSTGLPRVAVAASEWLIYILPRYSFVYLMVIMVTME